MSEKLNILVVEDVALNREVAEGLLQRDGHQVWLANDAEQAWAQCSARSARAMAGPSAGSSSTNKIRMACLSSPLSPRCGYPAQA